MVPPAGMPDNPGLSLAAAEAFLDSASEGIVVVGEDGLIRTANRSALRMFAYEPGELPGQSLDVLLPEPLRARHRGHVAGYFAAPRNRPMGVGLDLTARRKDGSEFPVEISLSFLGTRPARLAVAFVTDITERKRTESQLSRQREALYQSEKMAALGTLAAGFAHEINNPIGIIASRIELMLTEPEGRDLPPRVREDMEVVQRNVQRVGHIAHSLLSFARQSPRDKGPVDLNRVVDETLLLVRRQLGRSGITVQTRLDPGLPPLLGDPGELHQVLLNLLTNARDALDGGGEIVIETGRDPARPGWLRLVVSDSGPGIPAAMLGRIFDPFFTTKEHGTGLGLAVSYGIVQDHGGSIEAASPPGSGAVFTLAFPLASGSR